ncbi:MAG: hypothetical protein ACI9SP_004664 [Arenicella sp.]|jgi:hypothetical protein
MDEKNKPVLRGKNFRSALITNFFANKLKVFCFGLALLILGYLFQYFGIDDNALSRSGSVLVMFAVLTVYLNHFVSKEVKSAEQVLEITNDLSHAMKELDNVGTIDLDKPPQAISYQLNRLKTTADPAPRSTVEAFKLLLGIIGARKNTQSRLETLTKYKPEIETIEFSFGIAGTFIWGFGDLVYKWVACLF